jgi:hypothetical protein
VKKIKHIDIDKFFESLGIDLNELHEQKYYHLKNNRVPIKIIIPKMYLLGLPIEFGESDRVFVLGANKEDLE